MSLIHHYLWTAQLTVRCENMRDFGRTTRWDDGSAVIKLHRGLVEEWWKYRSRDPTPSSQGNLKLLEFGLHLVIPHEYMHAIMFEFGPGGRTPRRIQNPHSRRTESGFWAETWLSQ
ncbi:hypothetical protein BDR03DRAFT_1095929, partial [Suillus americanus]